MALILRGNITLIFLGIIFSLVGCTTPTPTVTAPPTPTNPTPFPPTATLPPPATPTPAVTALPLPTDTPPAPLPPTEPPPLACWTAGGKVTELTLDTPLTPNPWPFRIYTPPCYEEQPDRHYPLLILMHGTSFTDDQWDRIGVDETANTLMGSGEIPPFLILMPYDWYWTYEPFRDPFGDALREYLLPWIDTQYRTLPQREYRAIGGLSRGASWAVHLGLEHWELFGAVGGHSLPMFPSDPSYLEQWLKEIPRESVPRFFLDIGEEDNLLAKALWFENLLNNNNVPHEWYLFPGTHEEAYWTAHLPQYLRWYAQTWSHLQ